ncbi:MAG: AsmA family protein [Pseudomonadota bacterium]|nr:MAG: hypothetical protein DIU56_03855 [Pseudomonadota bacterium]
MRARRWVVAIVVGSFALVAIAVATLTLLVDPNVFRDEIEAAVRARTGLPLRIEGELDIAWFPWLAVRTGAAGIGSRQDAGEQVVKWESARVGARLVPLLQGRLVIDRIRVDGLHLDLRRDATGHGNWEDLLQLDAQSGSVPDADSASRATPEIAGLEIRDGAVDFVDARSGRRVQVREWNLDAGEWRSAVELPIRSSFSVVLHQAPESDAAPLRAEVQIDLHVTVSDDFSAFELRDTTLDARIEGGRFGDKGIPIEMRAAKLSFTREPLSFSAPDVALRIADARVQSSVEGLERDGTLRVGGPVTVEVPSLRALIAALGLEVSPPRDPQALGALEASANWALENDALVIEPLRMKLDGTTIAGRITRSAAESAVWTVDLRGDEVDLGRYVDVEEKKDDEPFELPVDAIRALPLRGSLAFDRARYGDTQMKNLRLHLEHEGSVP